MGPLDETIIKSFLRADAQGKVQKEDDKLEYKEVFDNSSKDAKAKYAKEMAALHNYQGGYLIFGINDANELVGLHGFTEPDNAKLVDDINTYFSPAIRFQSKSFTIDGRTVFVIYVEKRTSIPTVCIRDHDKVLSDGTIYWRYSAKSSPIKSGDLIHLLQSLRGEETARLTEIAEKEFRSKSKPRLWLNGGMRSGKDFHITIENSGEVAYLDQYDLVYADVDLRKIILHKYGSTLTIEKNGSIRIPGQIYLEDPNYITFKLLLRYHDRENYKYEMLIEWNHGHTKIIETKEL